jgi:aryl-alcohol dehydrogenase-like predicted oxidoreductase
LTGAELEELAITEQALLISKIDPQIDPSDPDGIKQSVEASCRKLRISQLFGMMLHRATWLDHWDRGLGETLRNCMGEGKIRHLGVSICSVAEAKRALANPDISMIQLPANAWDQRMHEAGIFAQAQAAGKICFIRSIYLQGLLTLAVSEVKEKLPLACEVAQLWQILANKMSCTPVELAFRYALSLDSPLVIGAENIEQVRQNLQLAELEPLTAFQLQTVKAELSGHVNENILNPSNWNVS